MRNAAATAIARKAAKVPSHSRANDRARGETRISTKTMIASTREFRQRFLTLTGNGPMCVKPLPPKIASTNNVYTAAAAMSVQTIGISIFDAATGRVRACVQAAETLPATPIVPRHSAAIVGNSSPSAFGYPRITLPQSRDWIGEVQ